MKLMPVAPIACAASGKGLAETSEKEFPSPFLLLGVFDTLILSIYSCDNFHYWGLPWIHELVSFIARVRNSGSTFQSIHCNLI